MGAGAHALRVAHDHGGALAEGVQHALHAVDEGGGERLHALDRDALGQLAEQVGRTGELVDQGGGPLAHDVGQQQLPAGRRPQPVLGHLEAALVGDLEPANLLDGVTPELHTDGVVLGGWEDVEDTAAHGELAAPLHEVGAGVCRGREVGDDLLQGCLLTRAEGHRAQVAQSLHHRLENRAHRRDDDVEGAVRRVVGIGVAQAAQHGEALADGVAARTEPLVGQRLPGREVGDGVGVEEAAQGGAEVLGLPRGGRHGEQRPGASLRPGADQRGQQRRARARRDAHVDGELLALGGGERGSDAWVAGEDIEQVAETHGAVAPGTGRQHERPTAGAAGWFPSLTATADGTGGTTG